MKYIITYCVPIDSIVIYEVSVDFELDPSDADYIVLEETLEL